MERAYTFHGTYFSYQGHQIVLDERTFLLDGAPEAAASKCPYVYRDLQTLLKAVNQKGADREAGVTVYIAPDVYWLHDPLAEDIVTPGEGCDTPYGAVVEADRLRLIGLSEDAGQVVLAANRGQSHGALGNYTMFCFQVRDLEMRNLTLGNYCSVDLEYPSCPEKSRGRRTGVITQAQLAKQTGDRFLAENCRFVSRLNLYPVCGAERCLYAGCHFESTDDSLNGHAVYVDCNFDFYANRPLYDTRGSGAVFLNCLFHGKLAANSVEKTQYFTKEGGQVTAVDCQYEDALGNDRLEWTKYPLPGLKCYQYGVSCHGKPLLIGSESGAETVLLEGRPLCGAYRLEEDGKVIYNTYNLLRGEDDWDPLGVKQAALRAGREAVPTCLRISTDSQEIVSGETAAHIKGEALFFYGKKAEDTAISYYVEDRDRSYVRLTDHGDGTCTVEGSKEFDPETAGFMRKVRVCAVTEEGLEAAVELTLYPHLQEAPTFRKLPTVERTHRGTYRVSYELALDMFSEEPFNGTAEGCCEDCSVISWYCCPGGEQEGAVPVAVSRGEPLREFDPAEYFAADDRREAEGHAIMAVVEPRHGRSKKGEGASAQSSIKSGIEGSEDGAASGRKHLVTDFAHFPTRVQAEILPGFWTVDACCPKDAADVGKWEDCGGAEPWKYGETGNGSVGFGLYQNVRGARLLYTPVDGRYGDMSLYLKLDPAKTAGQGFGSAGQYMDICIKFDTKTLSGYGLRILRKKEAADGVWFLPVQYENGETHLLSEGVLTSCYRTGCEIWLRTEGNCLMIHGQSETLQKMPELAGYARTVDLEFQISGTDFGGIAIWHTGTPGTGGWQNTTMFHKLEAEWKEV